MIDLHSLLPNVEVKNLSDGMSLWLEESILSNATIVPKAFTAAQVAAVHVFTPNAGPSSIYAMHCQVEEIDKIAVAQSTLVHA